MAAAFRFRTLLFPREGAGLVCAFQDGVPRCRPYRVPDALNLVVTFSTLSWHNVLCFGNLGFSVAFVLISS